MAVLYLIHNIEGYNQITKQVLILYLKDLKTCQNISTYVKKNEAKVKNNRYLEICLLINLRHQFNRFNMDDNMGNYHNVQSKMKEANDDVNLLT